MFRNLILTLFVLALVISMASAGRPTASNQKATAGRRPSSAGASSSSNSGNGNGSANGSSRNVVPRVAKEAIGLPPQQESESTKKQRPKSASAKSAGGGKSNQRGSSRANSNEEDDQGSAPSSTSSSSSSSSSSSGSSSGSSSRQSGGNANSNAGNRPSEMIQQQGPQKIGRSSSSPSSSASQSEQGGSATGSESSAPNNTKAKRQAAIKIRGAMRMAVRAERREGRGTEPGIVPSATSDASEPGNVLNSPQEEIGLLRDERRKVRLIKRFDRQLRRKKGSKEEITPSQLRREKHRLAREENRLKREEERDERVGVKPATMETIKRKARSVIGKRKNKGKKNTVKHRKGNIYVTIHLK
ncbi:hypothetical protein NAEGRDRAFT_79016 [Naegleria gruberi]|uniref:Uncharacterized protein n=1 Tax=Naegleria gruberi TaxID=5762 RepID=D2V8M6_NAEGR|nr:uncharacterized protein NAEGRDRAFT_79016 [Naegleria gruberi]EFC46831.1 hypothetical protein NAEGRDRAFT_79016 [Naegleria gruberi]|eukprot:XP_002679575.1 hypothetical protein NAEGRDRAFT_79016 [Naegleria gruberi strain NEG-M]